MGTFGASLLRERRRRLVSRELSVRAKLEWRLLLASIPLRRSCFQRRCGTSGARCRFARGPRSFPPPPPPGGCGARDECSVYGFQEHLSRPLRFCTLPLVPASSFGAKRQSSCSRTPRRCVQVLLVGTASV